MANAVNGRTSFTALKLKHFSLCTLLDPYPGLYLCHLVFAYYKIINIITWLGVTVTSKPKNVSKSEIVAALRAEVMQDILNKARVDAKPLDEKFKRLIRDQKVC